MGERTYPVGVPCWVDIEGSEPRFYAELFGWELAETSASGYQVARLRGGEVAGFGAPAPGAAPAGAWNTYVRVESAATAVAAVGAAGGTVVREPYELPGRIARVAVCADPAGAAFRVWQPLGVGGAERVNEPSSWNFSELNTSDQDGAKDFYGTVFGWEARSAEFGPEVATMWCVRGYGDVQDMIEPGFRRRHEEGGSPEGFVDAVGWLQPLTAGDTPHWSITFAVADAEAVAERAASLGGEVLVPPFAAGGAQLAVLRDPRGAAFTVTAWHGP